MYSAAKMATHEGGIGINKREKNSALWSRISLVIKHTLLTAHSEQ